MGSHMRSTEMCQNRQKWPKMAQNGHHIMTGQKCFKLGKRCAIYWKHLTCLTESITILLYVDQASRGQGSVDRQAE